MEAKTISRIGNRPAGFTLLEILLALAVIGLIATVLIGGSARMLAGRSKSPDDLFWEAVNQSRKMALLSGQSVRLSFDNKSKTFLISDGVHPAKTIALSGASQDTGVDFVPGDTASTSALLGGSIVETTALAFVTFYADGTCSPFRGQIRTTLGAHVLKIDPWTCAPVLTPLNPDGTPAPSSST